MILSEYVAQIRIALSDTDPADYRWTDADLETHIGRAVRLYNEYCHLDVVIDAATTLGSRIIDLSTGGLVIISTIVEVYHVEYPIGEYPPFMQQFSYFQTTLTIEMAEEGDGSNARLYCGMLHTVTEEAGTIPSIHEEWICLGATAFALYQKAVYSADRVSIGGEKTASEFAKQAADCRVRFDAWLSRLNRKLRRSRLYTPAALPQTTPQEIDDHAPPPTPVIPDYTITASVDESTPPPS